MTDVLILTGDLTGPYEVIGPIQARVTAKTLFSKDKTPDEANAKLRGEAVKCGANAVINVTYDRGISATSWKALTARGLAVVASPEARPADFQPAAGVPTAAPAGTTPAGWNPDPTGRHELRYWDGQQWSEHVSDAGTAAVDPM